ncbi:uncharacterized protein PHACADRAFT_186077 [Phanerochaete carnosa HHB-10118-sp]|uniref:GST C-terminal domain-containing protein n=1 Tax=Phanerochaete carnosa (strain HHB-10118-sp) TaxID=650164 RepID=K5WSM6_PHACS|nr:uncharacterized protein PHACADRAFT_186077 [Phanerochaete carnosa HHB-10118-sp]EKM53397.1 hypothetical protein PHACADRAFT_186077 [Phanerochaete carnosa HHB-10118-sp]
MSATAFPHATGEAAKTVEKHQNSQDLVLYSGWFLEDAYPDYKPNLLPADPVERTYARIWIDFISRNVVPNFMRLMQAQTADKQTAAREDLVSAFRTYAEKVKGPYFLGEEFSLVDVAIASWIVHDWVLKENRGYDRAVVSGAWKTYADTVE